MAPQLGSFDDNVDRVREITWDNVRLGIVEITIRRPEMGVVVGGGGGIAPGTWEVKEEYQHVEMLSEREWLLVKSTVNRWQPSKEGARE